MYEHINTADIWEPYFRRAIELAFVEARFKWDQTARSLQTWLNDLLNHPIPANWPDELARFARYTAYYGVEIMPESLAEISKLIESRVKSAGPFAPTAIAVNRIQSTELEASSQIRFQLDDGTLWQRGDQDLIENEWTRPSTNDAAVRLHNVGNVAETEVAAEPPGGSRVFRELKQRPVRYLAQDAGIGGFIVTWDKFTLSIDAERPIILIQEINLTGQANGQPFQPSLTYYEIVGTVPKGERMAVPHVDDGWIYTGNTRRGQGQRRVTSNILTMTGIVRAYALDEDIQEQVKNWQKDRQYPFGDTAWGAGSYASSMRFDAATGVVGTELTGAQIDSIWIDSGAANSLSIYTALDGVVIDRQVFLDGRGPN